MIKVNEIINMKPGNVFQDWLLVDIDGYVAEWGILTVKRTKRKYKVLVQSVDDEVVLKTSVLADVNNSYILMTNLLNIIYELWND